MLLKQGLACEPDEFCEALVLALGARSIEDVPAVTDEPPADLPRVAVNDATAVTPAEKQAIAAAFGSRFAAVGLQCRPAPADGRADHPMIALAEQLSSVLPCAHRMRYAVEAGDGTGKLVDAGHPTALGRSNRALPAHQDGLSSGAHARIIGLWADSVAAVNPRTFVQNLVRVAADLRKADEEAFAALFAADALTIRRVADGQTIVSPALLLDHHKVPRAFFCAPSSEYDVIPADRPAAKRGFDHLLSHSRINAPGSASIELSPPGTALLFDNRVNVHGRSAFQNDKQAGQSRMLALGAWSDTAQDVAKTVGRAV